MDESIITHDANKAAWEAFVKENNARKDDPTYTKKVLMTEEEKHLKSKELIKQL